FANRGPTDVPGLLQSIPEVRQGSTCVRETAAGCQHLTVVPRGAGQFWAEREGYESGLFALRIGQLEHPQHDSGRLLVVESRRQGRDWQRQCDGKREAAEEGWTHGTSKRRTHH